VECVEDVREPTPEELAGYAVAQKNKQGVKMNEEKYRKFLNAICIVNPFFERTAYLHPEFCSDYERMAYCRAIYLMCRLPPFDVSHPSEENPIAFLVEQKK
jgi:hypothetical protein